MKTCTKCKVEKEETEFFFKNKSKNKLHSYCKECKRELDRLAYQIPGNIRKEKIRINSLMQIKRAKDYIREQKQNGECRKCGDKRWYVLDFHHLRDKNFALSELAQRGPSIKRIQEEIDKCDLLCANCHREEHYLERMEL